MYDITNSVGQSEPVVKIWKKALQMCSAVC